MRFFLFAPFLTNALVLRVERKEERGRAPIGPEMGKRGRASRDAGTPKSNSQKRNAAEKEKDVEGRALVRVKVGSLAPGQVTWARQVAAAAALLWEAASRDLLLPTSEKDEGPYTKLRVASWE